jgi:hypothetical protein
MARLILHLQCTVLHPGLELTHLIVFPFRRRSAWLEHALRTSQFLLVLNPGARRAHLGHLKLGAPCRLAVRKGAVAEQGRQADDGSVGVPMLVGKPLAAQA